MCGGGKREASIDEVAEKGHSASRLSELKGRRYASSGKQIPLFADYARHDKFLQLYVVRCIDLLKTRMDS
jgi:hypothetical protein